MDVNRKAEVLHSVIGRFFAGRTSEITAEDWVEFCDAQNDGYQTGPTIGEKVPDFMLPDQRGVRRSLGQLMGSNGLLLVSSRSAHW